MELTWIDAFTDRPFAGNPAAVCVTADSVTTTSDAGPAWSLGDEAMQALAAELGLSETAYLRRRGASGDNAAGDWDLRWFTPAAEVELCGHATLASAHALWESGRVAAGGEIRFHTLSGVLTAMRTADAAGAAWIELDFPAQPAVQQDPPHGLLAALGVEARWVGTNGTDWLVEVASEAAVRSARPDLAAVARMPARGVIVTAVAEGRDGEGKDGQAGADFVSRFFAPAVGVDEDPVTGSAHCCLAPFWAARLGRTSLTGYQASPRGGHVRVELAGDRVRLAGQAVTVLRGELAAQNL